MVTGIATAERFAKHVIPEPNSGCWLWTGSLNSRGYGNFKVAGKVRSAHRVAFEIEHSTSIPSESSVCHRCDNPGCVNPEHLFLGTHQDNMLDRQRKGRSRGPLGEANARTALSADDVSAIRKDSRSLRAVAEQYGLSTSGVHGIRNRKSWRHVP